MTTSYLPETAPFSPQQRAWLNGFFAAVLTKRNGDGGPAAPASLSGVAAPAPQVEEDFPWHDSAMPLGERMSLAESRPYPRKLMAAMAQLDCGACGYVCQSYSEAIARGEEKDLGKCTPGGGETMKMLKQIVSAEKASPTAPSAAAAPPAVAAKSPPTEAGAYCRDTPFSARLVSSERLTHPDSPKDTRHVVIDLLESGLTYEAGDSLGVLPHNGATLVAEVLALLGKTGGETVRLPSGRKTSLRNALGCEVTLSRCRPEVFQLLAEHAQDTADKKEIEALLATEDASHFSADLPEVLAKYPSARPPLGELLASLAKLQPRLYSISSSQKAHPHEVHLTVGVVRFESLGRAREGVASNFLGVRSLPGDEVRIFVQKSKFRLPEDSQTPVIMVGPGTGIAPFRAFLQERAACKATGPTWLFFGNQYIDLDFLYRQELTQYLEQGLLTRLDLAFSRDSTDKVYVQTRMQQQAAELWAWLEKGAHFYICGDAKYMARDVEAALLAVIAEHGGRTIDEAKAYLAGLVKAKRYHKDVY